MMVSGAALSDGVGKPLNSALAAQSALLTAQSAIHTTPSGPSLTCASCSVWLRDITDSIINIMA